MDANSRQKSKVESLISSVLVTVKDLLTVEQLRKDFINVVGEEIPYRKFGCSNLMSFLESIPNTVTVIKQGNSYYVKPVVSKDVEHIAKLVQGQKASKKPAALRNPVRRPHTSRWAPPSTSAQRYGRIYQHPNYGFSQANNIRPSAQQFRRNLPNRIRQPPSYNSRPFSQPNDRFGYWRQSEPSNFRVTRPNFPSRQSPPLSRQSPPSSRQSPPSSRQSPPSSRPALPSPTWPTSTPSSPPVLTPSPPSQVYRPNEKPALLPSSPVYNSTTENLPPSLPSPPVYNSAKEKLQGEAKRLNIKLSNFATIEAGMRSKYWISRVTLEKTSYSTYPKEIKTKEAAEEAAATAALKGLEALTIKDDMNTTTDFNIALKRIIEMVLKNDAGIWLDALEKKYKSNYNERLPAKFFDKCKASNLEEIEFFSPDLIHWIAQRANHAERQRKDAVNELIFHLHNIRPYGTDSSPAQVPDRMSNQAPDTRPLIADSTSHSVVGFPSNNVPVTSVEDNNGLWPHLEFPKDKLWNVYVTYIKNCNSIAIRLIGKEYHEKFENLTTNMELYYVDAKNRTVDSNIAVGKFYACALDETWFRVSVEKIIGENALVSFVDHGDDELVPLSTLCTLKKEFQRLPMQSIPCTLAGLDVGFEHELILKEFHTLALGRSLVAEVLSQEPDISVVLYDTSTDDDLNINERLLQILPETFTTPQLPSVDSVCEAYITHVDINGDIYITFDSKTYEVMEALLDNAENNIKKETPSHGLIDVNKMYLSKYSIDGQWNRSTPRSANLDTNEVLMQFVDIGASENVPSSAIVPLDEISPLLCKIPNQAVKCRLHNVPSSSDMQWTEATRKRLNQLLPATEPLLLKVLKAEDGDKLAEVEVFKRLQPQNELVSINATLSHDSSLFRKNEQRIIERRISLQKCDELPIPRIDLPEPLKYFDVHVSYAASPQNFGVQNLDQKIGFKRLMEDIQCYYNKVQNHIELSTVTPGQFCAAQYTDDIWYRIKVEHCGHTMISGLKVDYGDIVCTTMDKIQPLLPKFRMLPLQGFRASLWGVNPINKDWTPEDCLRFRELVEGKDFVSVVLKVISERESLPQLELKLIDTSGPNDVYLDQLFIKEGRAHKMDTAAKK